MPHHTTIIVDGTAQHYEPIRNFEMPLESNIKLTDGSRDLQQLVRKATASGAQSRSAWAQMRAHPRSKLRVSVLGSSSSSGCGGLEPAHKSRCFNFTELNIIQALPLMSKVCSLGHSWARRMHDSLMDKLRAPRPDSPRTSEVVTSVHPRNAMGAGYFARCTSRFVSASTDVVILELAQVNSPGRSPTRVYLWTTTCCFPPRDLHCRLSPRQPLATSHSAGFVNTAGRHLCVPLTLKRICPLSGQRSSKSGNGPPVARRLCAPRRPLRRHRPPNVALASDAVPGQRDEEGNYRDGERGPASTIL